MLQLISVGRACASAPQNTVFQQLKTSVAQVYGGGQVFLLDSSGVLRMRKGAVLAGQEGDVGKKGLQGIKWSV